MSFLFGWKKKKHITPELTELHWWTRVKCMSLILYKTVIQLNKINQRLNGVHGHGRTGVKLLLDHCAPLGTSSAPAIITVFIFEVPPNMNQIWTDQWWISWQLFSSNNTSCPYTLKRSDMPNSLLLCTSKSNTLLSVCPFEEFYQ